MKRAIDKLACLALPVILTLNGCNQVNETASGGDHEYNSWYSGKNLDRVAFPVGGIGAGMFCIEGTGAISHMSVRNRPEVFNEPCMFAAISVKGIENGTKILEGMVPDWKKFGTPNSGNGSPGVSYGFPRFEDARFITRFPFATIELSDNDIPVEVSLSAWSPFIPTDQDNSSLPAGAIEYNFKNTGRSTVEAVFSYSSKNFMAVQGGESLIKPISGGFILSEKGDPKRPETPGDFSVFVNDPATVVDHCWFRGGWWDPLTMAWNQIMTAEARANPPVEKGAPGASLFVPFSLAPGESRTVRLMFSWYVPNTKMRYGQDSPDERQISPDPNCSCKDEYYRPWYSGRFAGVGEVANYWIANYADLKKKSELFRDAFYAITLPPEVVEAVAANLTILKSPTVLRQPDGKMWAFEGCSDNNGCCAGSCTHVWNYAQAVPHLFPKLERTLRGVEFFASQDTSGHQTFRAALPVRAVANTFHAASDGQLGGIMKMYRDWRISGNHEWLKKMYPQVKESMDYCIRTWDPRHTGTLEEPHHNTYDIEFWGPDGMCTSFYLGALRAMTEIGKSMGDDVSEYEELYGKGRQRMESELYNGEFFIQKIAWKGLNAPDPEIALNLPDDKTPPESKALLIKEGPKYQYGTGCLSDGVLGTWIAAVCGLRDIVDSAKIASHLLAVYKYNFRKDLTDHINPQRPSYAMGREGGLLLCTWPNGGALSLPFPYSNEVWTGFEYQVASHLMLTGEVEKGLDIVKAARDRYDGSIRNPFNEYECGHWYARAMSSYGMLQGLTGIRYDAITQQLFIDSRIGNDFTGFISTETGFGNAGLRDGKPFLDTVYGDITVKEFVFGKAN